MNGFYRTDSLEKVKFFDELQGKVKPKAFQIILNLVDEFLEDKTIKEVIFYYGAAELSAFEKAGCYNKTSFSETNVNNGVSVSDSIVCTVLVGKIQAGTMKEVSSIRQHTGGQIEQSSNMSSISALIDPVHISVTKTAKTSYRSQNQDIRNFDDGTTLHVYVPEMELEKE